MFLLSPKLIGNANVGLYFDSQLPFFYYALLAMKLFAKFLTVESKAASNDVKMSNHIASGVKIDWLQSVGGSLLLFIGIHFKWTTQIYNQLLEKQAQSHLFIIRGFGSSGLYQCLQFF